MAKRISQIMLVGAIAQHLAEQVPGLKTDANGIALMVECADKLTAHFNAVLAQEALDLERSRWDEGQSNEEV